MIFKINLFFIFFISNNLFCQIINGSFENWAIDPTNGYFSPVDWLDASQNGTSVFQVAGINSAYAVKIISVFDFANNKLKSGSLKLENMHIDEVPRSLKGYWYTGGTPDTSDRLSLSSTVSNLQFTPISSFTGHTFAGVSVPGWTPFSFPYLNAGTPAAKLEFELFLSTYPVSPNFFGVFDELELTFLSSINTFEKIITYFDVSSSSGIININLDATKRSVIYICILDITGKEIVQPIRNQVSFGSQHFQIDQHLVSGIYILKMTCDNGEKSKKFIVTN